MYPAWDTLQHMIKAWWKVAWQKAGKTLLVFFFVNFVEEHNNTNTKPQAKKQWFLKLSQKRNSCYWKKKMQIIIIRKVLCKSFIQWFWELNLCCYKYQLNFLGSLRLFFVLLFKWKSRNVTKHFMSGPLGNQLVLFSLESWCFPRLHLRKQVKIVGYYLCLSWFY